jgi:hypothetical protein
MRLRDGGRSICEKRWTATTEAIVADACLVRPMVKRDTLVVDHIEQRSCIIRKRGGVTLARAKILNYAPRRMTG